MSDETPQDPFELARETERKLRNLGSTFTGWGQQLNESADLLGHIGAIGNWVRNTEALPYQESGLGHLRSMIGSLSFDADRLKEAQKSSQTYIGSIMSGCRNRSSRHSQLHHSVRPAQLCDSACD